VRPVARIGTCGFRANKSEYAEALSTVEIQHTFYQPPMIATLERWRRQLPEDFEFTLKAWQLITHESTSPTYKRLRRKLTEKEAKTAGFFRNSAIVNEAWNTTLACAQALRAHTVLFQCPAKFSPEKANIKRMEKFFTGVERGGLNFAWEPRGEWNPELVEKLCNDLDLWHAVDPFSQRSMTPELCYFRLHGRVRWRYQYESGELEELATMLPKKKTSYVFFNNITMTQDAIRFQQIVKEMKEIG
jgi:uncharacterized protein YecE (DUF72 family)